jgi:energy-coupling factor transporter ATP-binding protein EcfA2
MRFPIFEQLDVDNYGMFPGTESRPGLHTTFEPGLTLVLGANGLGKTTLVTLLYRMCVGPYEIPRLVLGEPLGYRSIAATRLPTSERRVLAARVLDDAKDASGTLRFLLGGHRLEVTRSLATLAVSSLRHDDNDVEPSEEAFQELITRLTGLPAFGDWILILRYLVFYFEDRSALVWDPTAQRQVLRLLLLPTSTAAAWATKEREVLELDSRVRNLRNTLNREEGAHEVAQIQVRQNAFVGGDLVAAEARLRVEVPRLETITEVLPAVEAARQRARLRALTVEQERDGAQRSLERLQLRRISAAFPGHDETAKYLISRLLSTEVCQTCGKQVPEFAALLEHRITASECVVCGSSLAPVPSNQTGLARRLDRAEKELARLEIGLTAALEQRDGAEQIYDAAVTDYEEAATIVADLRAHISALVRRLPPNEQALRAQSSEVSSLRARLDVLSRELDERRSEFETAVRHDMATIVLSRDSIITRFQSFAEGFLFESSHLHWAPHSARVGQTGPTVEFPAFQVEMTGSDFPDPVRRSGPEEVSESQREFIDLAFRMALLAVAGESSVGSIVIDAPESSLDAVFARRAAQVLGRFADPSLGNRLVVTSNLVDGQLIPDLARAAGVRSSTSGRVLDLLEVATPTGAIRILASQYRDIRDRIFAASTTP